MQPFSQLEVRRLASPSLVLTAIPAAGGKVTSLVSARTGREWLWTDPNRPLSPRPATGDFADHELSGWDECFPTIGPCELPGSPGRPGGVATKLLDHGELWQRGWRDVSTGRHEIALEIDGEQLPYRFSRTIRVDGDGLRVDYRVDNPGPTELRCLWSMHPLFRAEPGMQIRLPGHPTVTKEFGFGGRIGADDDTDGGDGRWSEHRWPLVCGRNGVSDLSRLDFDDPPVTDKVVARGLTAGQAALVDPESSECLVLNWDANVVPYCGICINMGAWPFEGRPQSWVALEPSTGGTDRLDDADRRGEAMTVAPRGRADWSVRLEVRRTTDHNATTDSNNPRMECTP
jgi:galactose mutarotase-like enzyme